MDIRVKIVTFFLLVSIFFAFTSRSTIARADDTPTPTPSPTSAPDTRQQQKDLQSKISQYEGKIHDLQGQENTLSSQIKVMDNQVYLTQLRIDSTQQQIASITQDIKTATQKISTLQKSLEQLTKVLMNRIVTTYEVGTVQPFHVLLSADNAPDFFTRLSYLKVVQDNDKKLIFATEQAKNDYATQKTIFEDEKKKIEVLQTQLVAYTKQLDAQKQSRKTLLTETQGNEANYQKLLAQAQAQLAAFSNFTAVHGGASILSNQTTCDDWGCYYNQRDSQWGTTALNHTQYTIASDGCLLTSMAMVYTHYGHKGVTPLTINGDANNFASYYPAYLKYSINADGASSSRVGASIDGELAAGNPVIVGVSYDGGGIPDHFVVLISGSSGNYIMNDPFTPSGHKIPFTDHYSVASIREIDKVVF